MKKRHLLLPSLVALLTACGQTTSMPTQNPVMLNLDLVTNEAQCNTDYYGGSAVVGYYGTATISSSAWDTSKFTLTPVSGTEIFGDHAAIATINVPCITQRHLTSWAVTAYILAGGDDTLLTSSHWSPLPYSYTANVTYDDASMTSYRTPVTITYAFTAGKLQLILTSPDAKALTGYDGAKLQLPDAKIRFVFSNNDSPYR